MASSARGYAASLLKARALRFVNVRAAWKKPSCEARVLSPELGLRLMFRAALVTVAALTWLLCWEANHFLFGILEFAPGINLIFFPHGMRVLLTLLLGFWGATGIAIASALSSRTLWGEDPLTAFGLPLLSGYAGWLAYILVNVGDRRSPGETSPAEQPSPQGGGMLLGPAKISSSMLIALICLSAIINSGGHIAIHAIVSGPYPENSQDPKGNLAQSFAAMLCGDLFGGLILLYTLRWVILATNRLRAGNRPS